MEENKTSYLEKQIGAEITKDDGYTFVFQRARLKMQEELELQLVKEIDAVLQKEIEVTEDEVTLKINPPDTFSSFKAIRKKNQLSRWVFAGQLIKKIDNHKLERLNVIICPDNIIFDSSLTPYLLHYGVKESIPPYERDEERLLQEVKATVSTIVDGQHSFEQYFQFYQSLKLSNSVQEIFAATSLREISTIIQKHINELEKLEKALVHIPTNKWQFQRYALLGAIVLLVPALVYTLYTIFFLHPKQEAYVESGQAFLEQKYSEVIDLLEGYDAEDMPYVVQYELASSYIVNENLADEQRKNIEKTITLQTDQQYFLYWIYIGRGMNEEAIDIARSLEVRDLIMLGLIKRSEEIKADDSLSGDEKEQELDEIEQELDEYKQEQEEMAEQLEEEQQQGSPPTEDQSSQEGQNSNTNQTQPQLPDTQPASSEEAGTVPASGSKDEKDAE